MGVGPYSRRAAKRKGSSIVPVRVCCGQELTFGFTRDISCRGMSLFGLRPLPVGRCYEVEFTLPELGHEIKCSATVMWNMPHTQSIVSVARQGLMFDDLKPELTEKLDGWVKGNNVRVAA